MTSLLRRLSVVLLGFVMTSFAAGPASAQAPARGHGAEARDMELVGHDDLQGRSAYQPTIHKQSGRFIAYVGHHGGRGRNPRTRSREENGTSVVAGTHPPRPRNLAPRPGAPPDSGRRGAQRARVRDRQSKSHLGGA